MNKKENMMAADISGTIMKMIGMVLIAVALSDLVPLKDGLMSTL